MKHKKRKIVIVGTGGHARVILSILKALRSWDIAGLLDRESAPREELIEGYKIIGSWRDIEAMRQRADHAVVAVGDNKERKQLYSSLRNAKFNVPTLIHPSAYVDGSAEIGDGCVLCMGALVGANVAVGSNTIINSGAIVDHECRLESNVHIGPGARLAGRVTVGADTFVGMGVSIIDKAKIGKNVTIGAGSVVISDFASDVVVGGVPAKVIKKQAQ